MKTAAMVLGFVGGVIALIIALLSFSVGLYIAQYGTEITTEEYRAPDPVTPSEYGLLAPGVMGILGSAAGVTGGVLASKNRRLSGMLMTAGALACLPSITGIIAFIPLLAGGILILLPQSSKQNKDNVLSRKASPQKQEPLPVLPVLGSAFGFTGGFMAATAAFLHIANAHNTLLIAASLLGAALSVIAGILIQKRQTFLTSIIFIASAFACYFGDSGLLAMLLPFAGSILALIPQKAVPANNT